jgi:hypothetical protein
MQDSGIPLAFLIISLCDRHRPFVLHHFLAYRIINALRLSMFVGNNREIFIKSKLKKGLRFTIIKKASF